MRWLVTVLAAGIVVLAATSDVDAQALGVGGRLSWMRPDAREDGPPSERFWGGFARARLSRRTAVEVSLDYRRFRDAEGRRIRQMPLQGSLLLYPFRNVIGMYLLGGIGRYSDRTETPAADGDPAGAVTVSRTGYHAGLGGELQVGRHAALHVDYRYTFLHAGAEDDGPYVRGAIPIPGTLWLQEKVDLWHEGSMWTAGVTVYF
ncbi:MAG: outer membrane beta-barrel protein [Vicinamibacterales bacterium]